MKANLDAVRFLIMVAACSLTLASLASPVSAALFGLKTHFTSADPGTDAPAVDRESLAPYAHKGYGTIKGHISIPDFIQPGSEVLGSDSEVFLIPDVPYTRWYLLDYLTRNLKKFDGAANVESKEHRVTFAHFSELALKSARKYHTDAQGRYEFLNLPTGKYFVVSVFEGSYTGSVAHAGLFGGAVDNYKVNYIGLLVDEPSLVVKGESSSDASAFVRIVPSSRSKYVVCGINFKGAPCDDVIDLDQFTGGRSEY